MRWPLTVALALALTIAIGGVRPALAQEAPEEAPAGDASPEGEPEPGTANADTEGPATAGNRLFVWPEEPEPPVYETWWFWTAIGAVVLGVTLSIVIGVTTDHPRSTRAGLSITF